jgi:hypothetical protein
LQKLSADLDRLLISGVPLPITEYNEGELSILANQVQKLTLRLTEAAEVVEADKKYLADSLADISHQLRTPLTAMNLTTTMLRTTELTDEKRMELTGELRGLLTRTDWLVETLLKISKLDAGTVKLAADNVSVKELISRSAAPIAIPMDMMALALTELSNISERRIYRLISGQRGLPDFLVAKPGLNSGFMIPQYTAASIVSQSKGLCMPASADSIPSSQSQEDHVSMGANAATKLVRVVENTERVLAIELFNAAQALEFRRPLKSSWSIEKIFAKYRKVVPFIDDDRYMHPLIEKSIEFIR